MENMDLIDALKSIPCVILSNGFTTCVIRNGEKIEQLQSIVFEHRLNEAAQLKVETLCMPKTFDIKIGQDVLIETVCDLITREKSSEN